MNKIFLLVAFLSLSTNVFAQTVGYLSSELHDYVMKVKVENPDTHVPPYFCLEQGNCYEGVFKKDTMCTVYPSGIYLNANSIATFWAIYWDKKGNIQQAEVVVETPKTDMVYDWEILDGILSAKAEIVGLENFNLGVLDGERNTFFSIYDPNEVIGERSSFFSVEYEEGNMYAFTCSTRIIPNKLLWLGMGVTFTNKFGNPLLGYTEIFGTAIDAEGKEKVTIIPNPAPNGIFWIKWSNSETKEVNIYNEVGILQKSFYLPSNEQVIGEDLLPGLYFVWVEGFKPAKLVRR